MSTLQSGPSLSPCRTRIDEYQATYDIQEVHSIDIAAEPGVTYRAMRALDLWEVKLLRVLFGLRELPARILRRGEARQKMDFESLCEMGFILLDEAPGQEFVLGIVAKFWSLAPAPIAVEPEDFRALHKPGHCKATWNFHFESTEDGTRVTTKTRVEMGSKLAGVLFRAYWFFVAPFSGVIRLAILRHLRTKVETSQNQD